MNEQFETGQTEQLRREPWCAACKKEVSEWKVCFESSIHTDSGYDKVHRCPHCNALCFSDMSFSLGCLCFFLGLFGSAAYVPLLQSLGVQFDMDAEAVQASVFLFMFAHGIFVSWIATSVWKWRLYMRRRSTNRI